MATTIFLVNPQTFPSSWVNEYSLSFDGVDESLASPANTAAHFSASSGLTYSAWVNISTINTSIVVRPIIGISNDSSLLKRCLLYTYPVASSMWCFFEIYNGSAQANGRFSLGGLSTGTWYHIAAVFDGSQTGTNRIKIYLNGVSQTLTYNANTPPTTLPNYTSQNFEINDYESNNSENFHGLLDEVAIFDYGLSSAEVTAVYNSGAPTDLNNTSGLTAPRNWWRMGDGGTWDGTNWTIPCEQGNGDMTSNNMEEVDRTTNIP